MACGAAARLLLGRDVALPAPELLAPAVLLGALLGLGLGLLLARRAARPQPEKEDAQNLIRNLESQPPTPLPSEAGSQSGRRRRDTQKGKEEGALEECDPSFQGPVSAFALKAKVVYPINQKFRPLADGSSNPSLHEALRPLPHQPLDAASCSLGSLSRADERSSSSSVHSAASDDQDRLLGQSFLWPRGGLDTLLRQGVDVYLCTYSLFLRALLAVDAELRQEKHMMFLQILKMCLMELHPKKKWDEFCQKILEKQESDLEELEKGLQDRLAHSEALGADETECVTLADVERRERESSEQLMDHMEASWRLVGQTQQLLLEQFQNSGARARQALTTMTERMIAVEGRLRQAQDLHVLDALDRTLGRAHLAKAIERLRLRLPEDTRCRLEATSRTLELVATEGRLSGRQTEELLGSQHQAFWAEVERCGQEFMRRGGELVRAALEQQMEGTARLVQTQQEEREVFLAQAPLISDPEGTLQAFHELLEGQRLARTDLEDEHSLWAAEALAELCQELHSTALETFEELEEELFQRALPGASGLPGTECEALHREARESALRQRGWAGGIRRRQARLFRELLSREEQLWMEELGLADVLQTQMREDMEGSVRQVVERLGGLSPEATRRILLGHEVLLRSGLRLVALRGCALTALAQMRLSGQKAELQELQEQLATEQGAGPCLEEQQWQLLRALEARVEEETSRLQGEARRARAQLQEQAQAEAREVGRLLRVHAERALGLALRARARAGTRPLDTDTRDKSSLVDTAVESVYVTSSSVERLVGSYNQQLEQILKEHGERTRQKLTAIQGERLKELQSKPEPGVRAAGATQGPRQPVHQRLLAQRRRLLQQCSEHQQARLRTQGQKEKALEQLEAQLEAELQEAEQGFISELAALARVPLGDSKPATSRQTVPEKTPRIKKKKPPPPPQDKGDSGDPEDEAPAPGGPPTGSFSKKLDQDGGETENPKKMDKKKHI